MTKKGHNWNEDHDFETLWFFYTLSTLSGHSLLSSSQTWTDGSSVFLALLLTRNIFNLVFVSMCAETSVSVNFSSFHMVFIYLMPKEPTSSVERTMCCEIWEREQPLKWHKNSVVSGTNSMAKKQTHKTMELIPVCRLGTLLWIFGHLTRSTESLVLRTVRNSKRKINEFIHMWCIRNNYTRVHLYICCKQCNYDVLSTNRARLSPTN